MTLSENSFSAWDYVAFVAVLVISASIGIVYGFIKSRQKTTEEFLMANREMTVRNDGINIFVQSSFMAFLNAPVIYSSYRCLCRFWPASCLPSLFWAFRLRFTCSGLSSWWSCSGICSWFLSRLMFSSPSSTTWKSQASSRWVNADLNSNSKQGG